MGPAPHPIHSVLSLIVLRELVVCNTTVLLCLMWKKVWRFSHSTLLSTMWREDLYRGKVCLRGFPSLSLHCVLESLLVLVTRVSASPSPSLWLWKSLCAGKNLCTKEKIVSGVFLFVLTLFDLYGFWSLFDLSLFDLYGLGTACCSVFLTAPSFVELSEFPISGISKC